MTMEIRRVEDDDRFVFEIHEGRTWSDGRPRSEVDVAVTRPSRLGGDTAGVAWPSTSDRRPEMARAVAEAMLMAAREADRINAEALQKEA